MKRIELLKKRQNSLREDITANLDFFLIGRSQVAVYEWPRSYDKGERKNRIPVCEKGHCKESTGDDRTIKKMWFLLQKLSKVNWEILKLENE